MEVLRERGVDGIVHAGAQRDAPLIRRVAAEGTPIVTVNRRVEGGRIPAVVNDEREGMRLLVEHVHRLGHRRIAHIAGPATFSTGLARIEGLRAALAGLSLPEPAVAEAALFVESEGRRCARLLLQRGDPFTALLCANDRLALGAIEALREAGRRCPEEVSVTGFNDMPLFDRIPPALTTVRIPLFATGQAAGRALLALMRGQGDAVAAETVMPVELVVRDSTAPAPAPSRHYAVPTGHPEVAMSAGLQIPPLSP